MADPIYINVSDAAEGAALARAIGRYGLSAGLVRSDARWQVEISSPREDPRTFLDRCRGGAGGLERRWSTGQCEPRISLEAQARRGFGAMFRHP